MKQKQILTQFIWRALAFVVLGTLIGVIQVLVIKPGFGRLVPIIIGGLAGMVLGLLYKSERISMGLIGRLILGMTIGMFLGSVFGGMLGTIASFPFPDSWFSPIYLIGFFLGMFVGGIVLPIILVKPNWQNDDFSPHHIITPKN